MIFSTDRYTKIEKVFLFWCTNILDIHGNFSDLLDLLIDQRAHDCYVLIYFSHLPVKPRQNEPAHDKTNKIKQLSIRDWDKHRYKHGSISLTKH